MIAIDGSIVDDSDDVYDTGIDPMIDIVPELMSLATPIENSTALIATGMKIQLD